MGSSPLTLILLNKQRLDAAYGPTRTSALVTVLHQLADDDLVRGILLPVENSPVVSDTYAMWDANNACNPLAANAVAQAIKETVVLSYYRTYSPTLQYLVLVGDDLMLPFYRVPDDAYIANESVYTLSLIHISEPTRPY